MSNLAKNLDFLLHKHRLSANQLQEKSGITQSTTTRIISGETKSPRQNIIEQYAQFFKVSSQDLIYKDLTTRPSLDELKLKAEAIKAKDTQSDILSMARPVPVLSWVAAGSWSESNAVGVDDASDWLPRPLGLSEQGFALIVRGESMLPEFRPDDYIYVEPNISVISLKNGDLVVVQKADGSQAEATFKQLIIGETSDDMYLKPLNPNWHEQKMLPMTQDEWQLVGKVIGKYVKY